MELAITVHEAVDHDDLLVHTWRVARLTRLGVPELLAEIHADHLDWHHRPAGAARLPPTAGPSHRHLMILRRMRVMLEALQDEVRPVDARWMEPFIPHLQLEASPAAEAAAPGPALSGASGHPAEPLAGQSRPRPRPGRRTPALTPGKPRIAASAGPWQPGGRCHGPRTRRLPGQGVTAARTGSS
jgi:hypothetical protein